MHKIVVKNKIKLNLKFWHFKFINATSKKEMLKKQLKAFEKHATRKCKKTSSKIKQKSTANCQIERLI